MEHTRHAGTALRSGVPDNDNGLLLLLDLSALQRRDEVVLRVKDTRLAREPRALLSGDLADAATGGQAAAQDLDVAGLLDRVGERADDLLVRGEVGRLLEVLGQRLTGDGDAGAVDQALLEQELEQGRGAADPVQVRHDVLARRLQVGQVWGAVGDGLEVVDGQLDADGVGDGDEVQHGVGRAARDVHDHHGVLEGGAGQDVLGPDILDEQPLDRLTGSQALKLFFLGLGRAGRRAGESHTHDLDGGGHGVRGVHTTAGTATGAGVADNVEALLLVDLAGQELAVRLERGDDVDVGVALGRRAPGHDRTAVHHQTGAVHSSHRHQDTGHVLVAAGDADVGIIPLPAHDGLDRVGDQIAALQRVAHARSAHADAVADTNGVELEPDKTGALHTLAHLVAEVEQVHVARVAVVPDGGDPDLRLVHVLLLQAGGVEHGLGRTLGDGLCDMAGDLVDGLVIVRGGGLPQREGGGEGAAVRLCQSGVNRIAGDAAVLTRRGTSSGGA